ncbi:MAG: multiple resistance and pH regulation protein F [Natronospirillum sp.]
MMWLATLLLLTIFVGLYRVVRGPTAVDRLMSIQLFGTAGVAIMLILAQMEDAPALRDAALVLALLAAVVSAALVQYLRRSEHE